MIVNGLDQLLRDIDRPELLGEGLTVEVAEAIVDGYPPTDNRSPHAGDDVDESWRPVDLTAALVGGGEPVTPTVFRRDDGARLFYRARVNFVWGDSGEGKSMVLTAAGAQELTAGEHVVWIDLEDNEDVIVERLRLFGAGDTAIQSRFHYYRPTAPFDDAAVDAVLAAATAWEPSLLVIDSLGEVFGLEGVDEDRDVQVGPWLRRVARTLADAGPAVVIIDHATKAKDNPLFPSGSKRKRAAITGAAYLITAVAPLTRDKGGRLTLTCAKDRHGHYRRGELVATFDLALYPDAGVSVKIWPPMPSDVADGGKGNLHFVARAATRAAKALETPASVRRLVAQMRDMNVKGATESLSAGIEHAVTLGALRTEPGPRRSILHHYVKDLDD